ncbi:thiol-disulfide isomerase/thioredoxin [Filimonas zeae]|nr:TlpA disulfide reductase family protein [Filimonas zeae]MDR6337620.1 thiol-disulfide isomerase/thioredoxin [Filimonas zeae]
MRKWAGLLMLLCVVTVAKAQYPQLQFTPDRITSGEKFSFTYNAAGTPLENKADVSCVLYYYDNQAFLWRGVDVPVTKTAGNTWAGEYTTPPQSAFITFKFVSGDSVDNNKNRSYGFLLLDSLRKGLNAPGAMAAWGLLRSPGYGATIEGYLDGSEGITDEVTNYWLDLELHHPGTGKGSSVFAVPFVQSLYKAYGDEKLDRIHRAIGYLGRKDAPLSDWERAWYIAARVIKDNKLADSLAKQIQQRTPVNAITKLADYNSFLNQRQMDSSTIKATAFLEKYPYADSSVWFDELNRIEYNRVYLAALLGKIAKNDFSAIDRYLNQLPFVAAITVYYKTIDVTHSRKMMSDSFLYNYSLKLIQFVEHLKENQPREYAYMPPSEWQKKAEEALYAGIGWPMYATHAEICNAIGRYEEALQYAEKVQQYKQFTQAQLNDIQVEALSKTGREKELKEVLLKSIYENQASVTMLEMLKKDYRKEYGSDKGFEQYLQSLKNAAAAKSNAAPKEMMNKPMPDFVMKDANGKKVSLSSLKGKVVILDFWAQWCIPCKASFPGMKLAVDKYKNDKDVVFYFVDTEEDMASDYRKANIKYLKEHGFNFNLLFDNPIEGSKKTGDVFERVCKVFTISGIPQKVLIDKKGNVRFITVGFKGSASALADELTEVIELMKTL